MMRSTGFALVMAVAMPVCLLAQRPPYISKSHEIRVDDSCRIYTSDRPDESYEFSKPKLHRDALMCSIKAISFQRVGLGSWITM